MNRIKTMYKSLVSYLDNLNAKDVNIKITPFGIYQIATILIKKQLSSVPDEHTAEIEIGFDYGLQSISIRVKGDNTFDYVAKRQLDELNVSPDGDIKITYVETNEDMIAIRDKLYLLIDAFLEAKPKEVTGAMAPTDKQDNSSKSNEERISALYKDLRDLVLDNASNFVEEPKTSECTILSFDTLRGHTEIDYIKYPGQTSLDVNIVASNWELYVNSQSSGDTIDKLSKLAKSKLSKWLNDGLLEEEKQDESRKSEDGLKEYIKEEANKEQDDLKEWVKNFNPYAGW